MTLKIMNEQKQANNNNSVVEIKRTWLLGGPEEINALLGSSNNELHDKVQLENAEKIAINNFVITM